MDGVLHFLEFFIISLAPYGGSRHKKADVVLFGICAGFGLYDVRREGMNGWGPLQSF
jgi:hypothetical protein